jgi:hypothetical protein
MDETFLLSNIAPQVGVGFNRHCTFFTLLFFFFASFVQVHDMYMCNANNLPSPRVCRLGLP